MTITNVFPEIRGFPGVKVTGVRCGIKKNGNLDFALLVCDEPAVAAGVFTKNKVKAAPVLLDMEHLETHAGRIRAVAINSGCANACTGQQGMDNARETARYVAERLNCEPQQVLVMSTGVIGEQLPMDKLKHGVDLAMDALGDDWESAARAIMTTDTYPKMASQGFMSFTGQSTVFAGIAKGAGMIAPNMATMLGVLFTNGTLTTDEAKRYLAQAVEMSFNNVVVDGDMSTNDTVFLLSTAQRTGTARGLSDVAYKLARDLVLDAEGATKFVTLYIRGAVNDEQAKAIGNTIAMSPLVKTAFYGSDANWGRIIAAAGRAEAAFDADCARLWVAVGEKSRAVHPEDQGEQPVFDLRFDDSGDVEDALQLFANGMPTEYQEADAAAIMKASAISVVLDCGLGQGQATIYTCDLSHEYVSINADYRT